METKVFLEADREDAKQLLKDHVSQEHGLDFYYEIVGKRMKQISDYIEKYEKSFADAVDGYESFKRAYAIDIESLPNDVKNFENIVTEIAIDSF